MIRHLSSTARSDNQKRKNVVGLDVREAREKLLADGFTVKVKGDGDQVLSQIPTGGQSVPQKGVIILYTSEEAKEETVEMPDLLGMTVNEATSRALAVGLNIKIAGNSLMTSELRSYTQSVEAGTPIPYGTTVTVHFKSNMGISDGNE
jgi:beta-lactam-binding protein with PASTA domain